MKLPTQALSAFALLALMFAPTAASAQDDVERVVKGNNTFALELYQELRKQDEGNAFVSPYSISTALAMTWAGARGTTAQQMGEVLGFDLPPEQVHAAFAELLDVQNQGNAAGEPTDDAPGQQRGAAVGAAGRLLGERGGPGAAPTTFPNRLRAQVRDLYASIRNDSETEPSEGEDTAEAKGPGYQLSVANALWAEEEFEFLPDYFDTVIGNYKAGLEKLSFKTNPDGSRERINDWVEEKTNDKIQDLLKPGTIKPDTRLVLTNAIYFKGKWKTEFDKDDTVESGQFTQADGNVLDDVALMYQKNEFRYAETNDLQVLELPYQGDDVAMTVILPRTASGLAAVEEQLSAEGLQELIDSAHRREVHAYLPRFKMTHELKLSETLKAMGMPAAFDDYPGEVDFSGMNGKKDLAISKVIHKAFVEVNEEGTEAAAATAVIVVERAAAIPTVTPVFRADRPFMFLIRDTRNDSILFMGRVTNPKSE